MSRGHGQRRNVQWELGTIMAMGWTIQEIADETMLDDRTVRNCLAGQLLGRKRADRLTLIAKNGPDHNHLRAAELAAEAQAVNHAPPTTPN